MKLINLLFAKCMTSRERKHFLKISKKTFPENWYAREHQNLLSDQL